MKRLSGVGGAFDAYKGMDIIDPLLFVGKNKDI